MSDRIVPTNGQVCVVRLRDGSEEYAVWDTGYSLYGAGGHFALGSGGMAGIGAGDVSGWWGTHWIVTEIQGIAIDGQTGRKDPVS